MWRRVGPAHTWLVLMSYLALTKWTTPTEMACCFARLTTTARRCKSDARIGTDPIVMVVEPTDYVAAADGPLTRLTNAKCAFGASTSTD
jgi:hypothetical protein